MTMSVLDRPDERTMIDMTDAQAVREARAQFQRLRERGYFAYREDGGSGGSGTVVKSLDEVGPDQAVVFVPLMVGG